ncbi:uncharacterized protein LOC129302994 [Prosopis cineraria]|uniref:uncharacterized protein LOC129302994 n=1 Tax=Prosopis cineraria TaxID=364024 RepID=UPI00240F7B15|nr:uncharacterized protein LOC129302994 [Prosopis cineraria]
MGKQILVAVFLASSAAVVVPPLVVVSVVGISVSIPFGLFLASHACTHKLMSQLLPMPATPSYVEGRKKECVVNHTTRGIEMGENEDGQGFVTSYEASPAAGDQSIGDGKKEDPQLSEHIKQIDDRPIPSLVTADEIHPESSNPVVNAVADVQNLRQCGCSSAGHITNHPSNHEVTVNEKLWKEINAIRVIVGYEGTPKASCINELKNLYILAGVEPPSLLNASGNSCEIHDQLHFLMSILGVKSNGP